VAIAEHAPDALFVLNSPYALDHNDLNGASLPADECISPEGRQNTLSAIIDKVASRKNHLSSLGYEGFCVGQTADKKTGDLMSLFLMKMVPVLPNAIITGALISTFVLMTVLWGHGRYAQLAGRDYPMILRGILILC
ncbi:TPA: hypothetical protein ACNOIO_005474, partial [Raoultella planticola]